MIEQTPYGYLSDGPCTRGSTCEITLKTIADHIGPDPHALAAKIRELMVHVFWQRAYGMQENRERTSREVNTRTMEEKLQLIRTHQKELGRHENSIDALPPDHKLIGNCRDFSLFFTALLRRTGIPARCRCGFGMYFIPNHGEDHWVVERWDSASQRWIICDPQLDDVMIERLKIDFDPMDMPDRAFLSGGEAWLACRSGDEPDKYGIFDMKGWDFIKGDLVRDIAALAGLELLPWDCWGVIERPYTMLSDNDIHALDEAAKQTSMKAHISRTCHSSSGLNASLSRSLSSEAVFSMPFAIEPVALPSSEPKAPMNFNTGSSVVSKLSL